MESISAAQLDFGPSDLLLSKLTRSIFEDFHNISTEMDNDPISALRNFERVCNDGIEVIHKIKQRSSLDNSTKAMLRQLTGERQAYSLIRKLTSKEQQIQGDAIGESLLTDLILEDSEFKRLTVLLDWCEENAFCDPQARFELEDEISLLEAGCDVRAETLHARKVGENLCDLDADGPFRGHLHVRDGQMQERVYSVVYSLIRRGMITKGCEVLERADLSSLVPSLKLREVTRDPYLTPHSKDVSYCQLPASYALFKRTVQKILEHGPKMSYTEQCLWSVLAGHLEPALSLCSCTEDRLWCYLNTAVEYRMDAKIADYFPNASNKASVASNANDLMIDSIFDEIATHENSPYYGSYRYLATGDSVAHVEFMKNWLERHPEGHFSHLLRYMAHIVLKYISDNQPVLEGSSYWILEEYVKLLISLEFYELVPFYASQLPEERTQHVLVTFMYRLDDKDTRLRVLAACCVDTVSLCKKIFLHAAKINQVSEEPSVSDDILINSWNWLTYLGDKTLVDALIQANFILRRFFGVGKLEQAKLLLRQTDDDIALVAENRWIQMTHAFSAEELKFCPFADALNEYRGYTAYLRALKSFNNWFNQFSCEIPKLVEKPSNEVWIRMDIQKQAAFEVHLKQSQEAKERHVQKTLFYFQEANSALTGILLQPGGWMNFCEVTDKNDQQMERLAELKIIRKRYLGDTANMLISMYQNSDSTTQIEELICALADNDLRAAEVLPRDVLEHLLRKLSVGVEALCVMDK